MIVSSLLGGIKQFRPLFRLPLFLSPSHEAWDALLAGNHPCSADLMANLKEAEVVTGRGGTVSSTLLMRTINAAVPDQSVVSGSLLVGAVAGVDGVETMAFE